MITHILLTMIKAMLIQAISELEKVREQLLVQTAEAKNLYEHSLSLDVKQTAKQKMKLFKHKATALDSEFDVCNKLLGIVNQILGA